MTKNRGFFQSRGNKKRSIVVIDEDPIGMLRPQISIALDDLNRFIRHLDRYRSGLLDRDDYNIIGEIDHWEHVAIWCRCLITEQLGSNDPVLSDVPVSLRRPGADQEEKRRRKQAFRRIRNEFHRAMRDDPFGTVRNVLKDLDEMLTRCADRVVYVEDSSLTFHIKIRVPKNKHVFILDGTADARLLRRLFPGRPIVVHPSDRIRPRGRLIQFQDGAYPRSGIAQALSDAKDGKPSKLVKIIDALGDKHPGDMVLISYKGLVEQLAAASRHADRIRVAHFWGLRGRNNLKPGEDGCLIVVGTPRLTEPSRQLLDLAIHGRRKELFPKLEKIVTGVIGPTPEEICQGGPVDRIWEVIGRNYDDSRMRAIYRYTTEAEIVQAVERARLLGEKTTAYHADERALPAALVRREVPLS